MSEKRDNMNVAPIQRPPTPIPNDIKPFGPPPSYHYAARNQNQENIPAYNLNERTLPSTIYETPRTEPYVSNSQDYYNSGETPRYLPRDTYTPDFIRSNERGHMPPGSQRYIPIDTQRGVDDGPRYMAGEAQRYVPMYAQEVVVMEPRSQSRGRLGSRIGCVRDKRQLKRDYREDRRDIKQGWREERRASGGPVSMIIGRVSQLLK